MSTTEKAAQVVKKVSKQAVQQLRKKLKGEHNREKAQLLPRTKSGAIIQDHGSQIYVFNHFQTNQVVYSLRKAMRNNDALKQLPYNGKKTVPRALRKDHWRLFANLVFPSNESGLEVFKQLREYRKLHELSWDPADMVDEKGQPLSRKMRGRKLCDQKANSVADMAAALAKLDFAALREKVATEGVPVGLGEKGEIPPEVKEGNVVVRWDNVYDAEFAQSWPRDVIHDVLPHYPRTNLPRSLMSTSQWKTSQTSEGEAVPSEAVAATA